MTALDEGELEALLDPLFARDAARKNPAARLRAQQIAAWLRRGAQSFAEMTDLPLAVREELAGRFRLYGTSVAARCPDSDGTVKLRIELQDGGAIEAVLLDDGRGRKTACLSTQAGCPVGCVFCKTGFLGFQRNLAAFEISEQFLYLEAEAKKAGNGIGNIVVMGMGEPLYNLDALRSALEKITRLRDDSGGFSSRRVTISTSGIAAGIRDMALRGPRAELAFSLNTAREELRRTLMPGARDSLACVKEALLEFQHASGRRFTLETVLLRGINTGDDDVRALAEFARGMFTVVNVIPWNPVEGLFFQGNALAEPSPEETARFIRALQERGVKVTRRYRKGRDVHAACGQLGSL